MQKKLTITVDESVYEGLHKVIGRGNISNFLENLAHPYVDKSPLEDAYNEMACDIERETEAMEWSDNLAGDAFDELR